MIERCVESMRLESLRKLVFAGGGRVGGAPPTRREAASARGRRPPLAFTEGCRAVTFVV